MQNEGAMPVAACDVGQSISSSDRNFDAFLRDIRSVLPEHAIETDVEELKARSRQWNSYHQIDNYPKVILSPENTEHVSKIMSLCFKYAIPVIPFGGGTSIEGQTLSPDKGVSISLDFNQMKKIIEFHPQDLDIKVQAGLGYVELNEMINKYNLFFPLDPGPGASVGGMCACRCSGSTALRYGSMRENVLNVTAVLSDGTIINTGSRSRKSSAGYDLTRLLVGSEGTLAVITEVTLKLHGIPKVSRAMRVCFDNVRDAAKTASETLNCGVTIGRCEMMDDVMVKVINSQGADPAQHWPEKVTLMYELTGVSDAAVNEQLSIVEKIAKSNGSSEVVSFTDPVACKTFWQV
jgi:D-lactate dehydrogenase (cytochrome)